MIEETAIDEELERLAASYKPKYRGWSLKDEARLDKFFKRVDDRDLARLLRRSVKAIQQKARAMGLYDEDRSDARRNSPEQG